MKLFSKTLKRDDSTVTYTQRDTKAPLGYKISGISYGEGRPVFLLKKIEPKNRRKSYRQFLQKYDWDLYFTFTPSFALSNKAARNTMNAVEANFIEQAIPFNLFFIIEPNPYRDGYHIHGLIKIENNLKMEDKQQVLRTVYRKTTGTKYKFGHDSYILNFEETKSGIEYILGWINHPNSDYDMFYSKHYNMLQNSLK